jgi:hypothetical protein
MSEHDDELASAYLDDDATAEERARVEADPVLLERVETLRRVRDAVAGAPVPAPSAAARESAIRAAIGAPPVVDLRVQRVRPRLRIAAIAAAAVLAVGVAGLLVRSVGDNGSPKVRTAAGTSNASSAAGGASSERTAAGAAALPSAANGSAVALGTFTDRSALAAAANAALSASPSTSAQADRAASAPTPPATGCAPFAPEHSSKRALAGSAVLDGEPVQVDVFSLDDGSHVLVVTNAGSCATVFTQRL